MTELTPEEISMKYARVPAGDDHLDPTPAKLEGIHGEGLGTGLPNDGDYSDIELRVLKFLHHANWDFDDAGHVWGPWMQKNHESSSRLAVYYRTCVHPQCSAVQNREGSGV